MPRPIIVAAQLLLGVDEGARNVTSALHATERRILTAP
jgi:hypothetical protein